MILGGTEASFIAGFCLKEVMGMKMAKIIQLVNTFLIKLI